MQPSTERPHLDEHDFKTLRELYAQAQNWARHYETLTVSTNVFLMSASGIFIGLALRDGTSSGRSVALFGTPVLMSLIGLLLTRTLFRLYALCVERLMVYEDALNCYAPAKLPTRTWEGALLPAQLLSFPVRMPASTKLFMFLHTVLVVIYAGLAFLGRSGGI